MSNLNPIFIIGSPRSGTSLLRVVLNGHKDLFIPPECGFAIWLYRKYKAENFNSPDVISSYILDLKKTNKFETWGLNINWLKDYLLSQPLSGYADLIDKIYTYYAQVNKIDFKRWGDKNNFYLEFIPELNQIFPNAQFIHCVRDGRDVACSYLELSSKKILSKYRPILPKSINEIAEEWKTNNEIIEESMEPIAESRKIRVRHEDLVTKFDETVNKLTDFLNLDYDPLIEFYYDVKKAKEPEEFMQWKEKLYQKPDISTIERYKSDLTPEQINIFNAISGSSLHKYDYMI
jgi:hypothetical protein